MKAPENILFVHLTDDPVAGEKLVETIRATDRARFAPIVLLATGGPVIAACKAAGAEVEVRPLCDCFTSACDRKPLASFTLRPGVMLSLLKYVGKIRSLIRERNIAALCSVSGDSRFLASIAGRLAGVPMLAPQAIGIDHPLRVLLLTDSDVFAGTERHMLDLARGLRDAGAIPSVGCPRVSVLGDRARDSAIEHVPIEKGGALDRAAIKIIRARLRSGATDVIHAHNGRAALIAALAVKLEGCGSYVLTQHFLIPCRATRAGLKAKISSAIHQWISRGAGDIIAISDASRHGIEERGEAASGNVTTVPNGIPAPDKSTLKDSATVRAALGIDPTRPLIVCAARLEVEKDVASLVAAMPAVLTRSPDAYCVVAGEGTLRPDLEKQIDQLGLRGAVKLAGFCDDALSLMNAADLFVLPSLAEPFGLVLIEGMSLGKAVISTNVGGPLEIVENGGTGILVPPANPPALAAAIAKLLTDPQTRAEMGRRGAQRYAEKFTVERMTAGILDAYRKSNRSAKTAASSQKTFTASQGTASRKPRVLLISHTCQTHVEGQPKAEQLARMGDIELMVLTPSRFNHFGVWKNAEPPQNPSYDFRARKAMWPWLGPAQNYLHWYPSLAGILREFQPDIIDLWEEPWALVSAHTCWLRNRILPGARILMETEQNIAKSWPAPFKWFENYIIRNASFAVGRSSGAVQVLRDKNYDGPARVVGNAVDTDLFRPMDRTECRRALGVTGFTVGYVGRMVERKGLIDMIEALKFIPGEITMVFVGEGEYLEAMEKRVRELGEQSRVRFLPARPLDQLPPVMNALDLFVLPSWTVPTWKEQFGRVIIEAHACETPVLGADSGAIADVIGDGGLIYPERDAEKLAAAIVELRAAPGRVREMGIAGRQQVDAKYTWRQVAVQMRDIYLECLDGKPASTSLQAPTLAAAHEG